MKAQGLAGIIFRMKKSMLILMGTLGLAVCACTSAPENKANDAFGGRKVGVQCYTFKNNTLEETINMLEPLGVKNLQAWSGQIVSKELPKKFSPFALSMEECEKVKKMLDAKGFKVISFGTGTETTEDGIKAMFDFAKYFGAEEISCEATGAILSLYDKYSKQYGIAVTLHNHDNEGKHNNYYDPYEVKKAIIGTSVMAGPDTGNWGRAGIDAQAALQVLKGKIYSIHLKDIDKYGVYKRGKSVAYGKGVIDMKAVLKELDDQGFDGYIYFESGESSKDPVPYVKGCVEFLKAHPKGFTIDYKPRKVAIQAYTFRKFTIEEMADKLATIGVNEVQLYPGQLVSKDINEKFTPAMPKEKWADVKKLFEKKNLKAVGFGVANVKDAEQAQQFMEFLKYFGITNMTTESTGESLAALTKAAKAAGIAVSIHHHASDSKSNQYYDTKVLFDTIEKDGYAQAMPDNGHWARSGVNIVEALRMFEGKLLGMHFKDHSTYGDLKSKCVPFGTGELNIPETLAELDRQNFDGYLIIENEHVADDPMPAVTQCVNYLKAKPVNKAYSRAPRKIAVQTYSLRKFSFQESLDMCKAIGIYSLDTYGRAGFCQPIVAGSKECYGYDNMTEKTRNAAKGMLSERGIKVDIIGVLSPKDEESARKVFEFAKFIGANTVNTEVVGDELLAMMDKLSKEYGIAAAIHNHAKKINAESRYYDPNVVKAITEKYPNLMAAPDNGHWARAGVDCVAGFKILRGKMRDIHFKDMSKFDDMNAEGCVYAKGVLDMTAMLMELDRQNFDGVYVIEYEADADNPLPAIERCANYLRLNPMRN